MSDVTKKKLCVIPGDGIGPEVVSAALEVVAAACDDIEVVHAEAGWQTFCDWGDSVPPDTLEKIQDCGAALFGAVSSPAGKVQGYQSAILTIRQALDLFSNIRPVRSGWSTSGRDDIEMVIVRENTEGLYCGREHRSGDRAMAEKIVTRAASERIGKMAADVARINQMKSVTIVHKANVLPVSEGLFRDSARNAIESCNPGLKINESLVDIVAHNLVARPELFEVLVTTNMFGDILSDLAAWWCGGMGRAPSLNLGYQYAVAEPVHGSAPDIAGQGVADPSATILSMAMLCRYFWKDELLADLLEKSTIMAVHEMADEPFTTQGFTDAVIQKLNSDFAPHDRQAGFDVL